MSITLTNTTRRIQIIILPHDVYCAALNTCACHLLPGSRPGDNRRVPTSLAIPANTTTPPLPDAIHQIPTIQRDIRSGALRVQRAPPSPPSPQPQPNPQTQPDPQPPPTRRPRRTRARGNRP